MKGAKWWRKRKWRWSGELKRARTILRSLKIQYKFLKKIEYFCICLNSQLKNIKILWKLLVYMLWLSSIEIQSLFRYCFPWFFVCFFFVLFFFCFVLFCFSDNLENILMIDWLFLNVKRAVFQLYFNNISVIYGQFYWWRKPEYRRKPPTCRKSLTIFIT